MPFEAYPLFGFRSGLRSDREPWLAAEEAFVEMQNASLFRGRVMKRPLARLLTKLGTKVIDEALGTLGAPAQVVGFTTGGSIPGAPVVSNLAKLVNWPLVPPTVTPADKPTVFTIAPYGFRTTGAALATDIYALELSSGAPTQPGAEGLGATIYGKINVATGEWYVRLTAPDAFTATAKTVTYEFYRGLPPMLITEWVNASDTRELVVCDTKRLFVWNQGRLRFDDKCATVATLATDDKWSGSNTDFFSAASVDEGSARKLVIVNGVNVPKKWTGTTLSDMGVTPLSHTSAQMVFAQYGHVIYIAPITGGQLNSQLAVWSDQFLPETVQSSSRAIAYTSERFITAAMVNDEIVCFFARSVWKLRYTGDFRAPFEWVHVSGGQTDRSDTLGAISRTGIVALPDRAVVLGPHAVVQGNGNGASETELGVPDLLLNYIDPSKSSLSYGVAFETERQFWFSYCSTQDTGGEPDHTLVLSMETGAVGFFDWSFRIFGLFRRQESVPNWDDVSWASQPLDSVTVTPNQSQNLSGAPTVLAGTLDGSLYEIPSSTISDELGNSTFRFRTKRLNPYVTAGEWTEARLSHWLIYAPPDPGKTATVRLYRDNESGPYQVETINLDPEGPEQQIIRRIQVNQSARWHQLEVEHTASTRWMVDAAVMHLKPGGRFVEA